MTAESYSTLAVRYAPALAALNAALAIKWTPARTLLSLIHAKRGISRKDYADLTVNCRELAKEKRAEGRVREYNALTFAADCFDPAFAVEGRANIDRHNAGLAALEQAAVICEAG
jgi:hypothetical protein